MDTQKIKNLLFGPPRDFFDKATRKHIALVSFMAWIGLGADGLSSSAYGPAEAFLALGEHTELAIYLAMATVVTVFIISIAYMQVIELFPGGGGGYKIASTLISPKAGLVSGSALIIDYVLTIGISVASGMDAVFSLFPVEWQTGKLPSECVMIMLLTYLNLRGMKESIRILMPIFLGFVITHIIIIAYGISTHSSGLVELFPAAHEDSVQLAGSMGWVFVAALFLKAFSLGGGTYTGLEAVSNNVHTLAEPKVKTGKITMLMTAASLALMAAGIITLYLLWNATPQEGKTLNAVVFENVMADWNIGGVSLSKYFLPVLMLFEAGLLLVAANTGFLAGPQVLANMGTDRWMPHFFSSLSSRLVIKNGIMLMGGAALVILLLTQGKVGLLVVLYSINVFLTFSLSLLGLCIHWYRSPQAPARIRKFFIALLGLIVTSTILLITVVEKFLDGGWMTLIITSVVIICGWKIKQRYSWIRKKIDEVDELFASSREKPHPNPPAIVPGQSTAAIVMHDTAGSGMHTLLWVLRLFPGVFKNFVFISVGEVDSDCFAHEETWEDLSSGVRRGQQYCVNYCHNHGLPATSYLDFGTDKLEKLSTLTHQVSNDFPKVVFFSGKLVFENETIFTQLLHNQNVYILQRRLHYNGHNMIILPMKV